MRKILAKKTTPRGKTPSTKNRVKRREIEPTSHVIERKTKKAPAKAKMKGTGQTTQVGGKSTGTPKSSPNPIRKAKKVGRAVGKLLGRAIGKVEQAITRAVKITDPLKK